MNYEDLRTHIEAASLHRSYQARQLTADIVGTCWPGGSEDRLDRAALEWLRLWRPECSSASLPACSCAAGYCTVCN
jgi:hypothetical protein